MHRFIANSRKARHKLGKFTNGLIKEHHFQYLGQTKQVLWQLKPEWLLILLNRVNILVIDKL